ncbi:MAG: TetR/AcrR family transcriptional regulator [Methylocystaceae bacterium]
MSTRREAEREARTNLIAETAMQLFTTSSYEEVTMDDIAREADFGKATLYHYFDSKESLLTFIINRAMIKLLLQIKEQCLTNQDLVEALGIYIELRYQYYNDCFPLLLYMLRRQLEGQNFEQPEFSELKDLREQKDQMMKQLLDQGVAKGVFIPVASSILLKVVDSLIRGFVWDSMEKKGSPADQITDKELIRRVLASGILVHQL